MRFWAPDPASAQSRVKACAERVRLWCRLAWQAPGSAQVVLDELAPGRAFLSVTAVLRERVLEEASSPAATAGPQQHSSLDQVRPRCVRCPGRAHD